MKLIYKRVCGKGKETLRALPVDMQQIEVVKNEDGEEGKFEEGNKSTSFAQRKRAKKKAYKKRRKGKRFPGYVALFRFLRMTLVFISLSLSTDTTIFLIGGSGV